MIKYVKSITDWQDIKNTCRVTDNKDEVSKEPTSEFKKRLLISEHSPIRMSNVVWLWQNIKSWVSVHFVRHKYGIEHFVSTQRDDRTNEDRDSKRQDSLVNHKCIANAQAIIYISRKRLCNKAHTETKKEWKNFLSELKVIEPELVTVCVPECVYRNGLCPEMKSCRYNQTKEFEAQLKKYVELHKNQINTKLIIGE